MTPKYLWDTSSLIDCCSWHRSLDEPGQRRLHEFLQARFAPVRGDFAIVERVWAELHRGMGAEEWVDVSGTLGFLERAILPDSDSVDAEDLELVDRHFFANPPGPGDARKERLVTDYLLDADPSLVLQARKLARQGAACIVVSEESLRPDGKKVQEDPGAVPRAGHRVHRLPRVPAPLRLRAGLARRALAGGLACP